MKMHLEQPDNVYRILSYSDTHIQINEAHYHRSLVVMPDWLLDEWSAASVEALSAKALAPVIAQEPEILLLGTGPRQHFPDRALIRELLQKGAGVEIMDTPSACRTYNILMSEGRRVAAALIMAGTSPD